MGFTLIATSGTATFFEEQGLPVQRVNKVLEGQPHIVDAMINGDVQLMFNTTEGAASLSDSASIRRTAVNRKIPYFTTLSASIASVQAITSLKTREISVRALQSV
jgi:carbamoyl-phosphate synthase large subunit